MLHIVKAEYIADYKIRVEFNDGFIAVADFESVIHDDYRPIIRKLSDIQLFKNFSITANTITWENGVDFAPEFIRSLTTFFKNSEI